MEVAGMAFCKMRREYLAQEKEDAGQCSGA
jgi:hypothetical protein